MVAWSLKCNIWSYIYTSVNKSGAPNFFIQHDKVEDSKLRRYLETFGHALEQFLQRRTSSTTPLYSYSACRSTDW